MIGHTLYRTVDRETKMLAPKICARRGNLVANGLVTFGAKLKDSIAPGTSIIKNGARGFVLPNRADVPGYVTCDVLEISFLIPR